MAINLSGMSSSVDVIYKTPPLITNWMFAIIIFLVLMFGIFYAYYRFRLFWKNQLIVRVHMPDTTIRSFRYKNFVGNHFMLKTEEAMKDGSYNFSYNFLPECIETGYWGKYIDYDYMNAIPLNPRNRMRTQAPKFIETLVSSILDSDLAVKLLRNSKFENLVKVLLVIILIAVSIGVIMSVVGYFAHPVVSCKLVANDNTTYQVIKTAVAMR